MDYIESKPSSMDLSKDNELKINQVIRELGLPLTLLIATIFVFFACSVAWIPANDFDTMSSYLARIKLEEFGPLKEVGTLEIQYIFPKFFDYLHKPFLLLGFLSTLPNFILFTSVVYLIGKRYTPNLAAWVFVLLFFCPSVLVTVDSAKSDITLGTLGFITWYFITYSRNSRFYIVYSLIGVSALIGTKWHGFAVAGPLVLYLIYNVIKNEGRRACQLVFAAPFMSLFFIASSGDVYIDNYVSYGTVFPKLPYLTVVDVNVVKNFFAFFAMSIRESFEPVIEIVEYVVNGKVNEVLIVGFYKRDHSILHPVTPDIHSASFYFVLVFICAIVSIFKQKSKELVISTGIGLIYLFATMLLFIYDHSRTRYLLASYFLMIVPAAHFMASLNISPKKYSGTLIAIFIIFSSYAIIFNGTKRLFPLTLSSNGGDITLESTWKNLLDRDALYFNVWSGYIHPFRKLQESVRIQNSLAIVNHSVGPEVPFIYPFIKDRNPSNTIVINTRTLRGQMSLVIIKSDFIMTFKGGLDNPLYFLIYDYYDTKCIEVCIFKKRDL